MDEMPVVSMHCSSTCSLDTKITKIGSTKNTLRFKLLIKRPQHKYPLPPLPQKKTAVDVFADFLEYLVKDCAEKFISESYPGGALSPLCYDREYVVSHPNGWESVEQQMLRQACLQASLIESLGSKNLHLVTEGESSLHFCLSSIPNLADFTVESLHYTRKKWSTSTHGICRLLVGLSWLWTLAEARWTLVPTVELLALVLATILRPPLHGVRES